MSAYAEQPFTEFEERYFLAEILKKSALPPAALLTIIREAGIEPAWTEIALPNGRSVSACQQAYSGLFSRTALPPVHLADPPRRLKRPFSSMGDATTALPRELQPRPPTFASVNGQQIPIPPPAMMSPVEPQRKKRGRPTKSEFERRQQEARERGEVWPKPRKPKTRPSTEGSDAGPGAAGGTTTAPGAVTVSTEGAGIAGAQPAPATLPSTAPTASMYSPGTGSRARAPGHTSGALQSSEQRSAESSITQGLASGMLEQEVQDEGPRGQIQSLQRPTPQGTSSGNPYVPQQTQQFGSHPSEERWQIRQQSQHHEQPGQ